MILVSSICIDLSAPKPRIFTVETVIVHLTAGKLNGWPFSSRLLLLLHCCFTSTVNI